MKAMERERRYELGLRGAAPSFDKAVKAPLRLGELEFEMLDATYYDTAEHRLLRAGIILWCCTGDDDAGWQLKLPGDASDERCELRAGIARPGEASVPLAFEQLLFAHTRGEALRPVAYLQTRRSLRRVVDRAGQALAVISDDLIHAEVPGRPRIRVWREMDVELHPGAAGLAKRLDAVLRSSGLAPVGVSNKLEKALREPRRRPPRPVRRDPVGARLRDQYAQLLTRDLGVRQGDAGAVHDMRVAARRLRACLQTFGSILPEAGAVELDEELQWLGATIGVLRDAQVLRHHLLATAADQIDGGWRSPAYLTLERWLTKRERRAQAELEEALSSRRYASLLEGLERFVESAHARRTKPAKLIALAERERRRFCRRLRKAKHLSGAERDVALHEARKAAKRARYAAETVAPLASRARAVAECLGAYQDLLGDRHDAVVAEGVIGQLLASVGDGIPSQQAAIAGFGFGLLAGRYRAKAEADDAELARRGRPPSLRRH